MISGFWDRSWSILWDWVIYSLLGDSRGVRGEKDERIMKEGEKNGWCKDER